MDSVKLCLQKNLIAKNERDKLWSRAKRKNPFYVGFLYTDAGKIPLDLADHPDYADLAKQLANQLSINNPYANALRIALSSKGQRWLKTLLLALEKPG